MSDSKKLVTLETMQEFNEKKTKNIFVAEDGSTAIAGSLLVAGTTTSQDTQTLEVKDNVIVANADGNILLENAGFAVRTNLIDSYGIMYDPIADGVKIGLGTVDENGKFTYVKGEDQLLATRGDSILDGNIPKWNNEKKEFVDSGKKVTDFIEKIDWNQNDSIKKDYLYNRPFYSEYGETITGTTIEETTFEGFDEYGQCTVEAYDFIVGATYTVTWDGVEYETVCEKLIDEGVEIRYIGNPALWDIGEDNGQPFNIAYVSVYNATMISSSDSTITSHTVKAIYSYTPETIHKLDDKYIDAEWMAKAPIAYEELNPLEETTVVTRPHDVGYVSDPISNSDVAMALDGLTTCLVTVDGVEYTANIVQMGDGILWVGNTTPVLNGAWNGDPPFLIEVDPAVMIWLFPAEGSHTVSIKANRPIYSQLPKEYIADIVENIQNVDSSVEAVRNDVEDLKAKQINITGAASTIVSENLTADKVLISDSNGKVAASETINVADLNALQNIASNLGEDYAIADAIIDINATTDSRALTWDGVVGDKTTVTFFEEAESSKRMRFVHITDELPNKELFMEVAEDNGIALKMHLIFGASMTAHSSVALTEDGNIAMAGGEAGLVIVYVDNYTDASSGLTFPKKGIYFATIEIYAPGLGDSDWIPYTWTSAANLPGASFSSGGSDKYFETKTVTTNFGETITWDGVVRDAPQETVKDAFGEGSGVDITLYRISSSIPPKEAFDGATMTTKKRDGTEKTVIIQLSDLSDPTDADGNVTGYQKPLEFGVVTKPAVWLFKTLPTGVYAYKTIFPDGEETYPTSITIPGFNFVDSVTNTVIKTEHLPQALRFGEIETKVYGDTLTWDGDTTGLYGNDGSYKITDVTPMLADVHKGFSAKYIKSDGSINEYTRTAEEASSLTEISVGEVKFISCGAVSIALNDGVIDGITIRKGTYFAKAEDGGYVSSFSINGYKDFKATKTELIKIDSKYLPDDIGGGNSGSGLPEVTVEDNNKSLKVVDGEWAVESLSYNDLSDKPTLDVEMSDTSVNTVQNKVIKAYVDNAIDAAIGAAIAASY